MTILENLGKRCYGCEACANVCPSGCISMILDEEGFRYPSVDAVACNDCGNCERSCPLLCAANKPTIPERIAPDVYAAFAADEAIRRESSSGGVFTILAESILRAGGIVVGAVFENLEVRHILIDRDDGLPPLRGSKYLQSRIGFVYRQIGDLLSKDRSVLFTGTPCQVAGLYGYLGRDDDRLLSCDLVCHGVPSGLVFESIVGELARRRHSPAARISFRDKSTGWKNYSVKIMFHDGSSYRRVFARDPFMNGFLRNLYLRPACHTCRYASIPRMGDLTLGDFWGVRALDPALDDDKGVSLVLVNSEKGRAVLAASSPDLRLRTAPLAAAVAGNPVLVRPATPSPARERFFRDFRTKPIGYMRRKYLSRRILSPSLRGLIGRMLRMCYSLSRRP